MLVGKELLDKARSLSSRPEDEIAKGCGYVGPSGRVLRKSFYRALVEAKGYNFVQMVLEEQEIDLQEEDKPNSVQRFMAMAIFLLDMPIQKN